jgi:hypothetical protein
MFFGEAVLEGSARGEAVMEIAHREGILDRLTDPSPHRSLAAAKRAPATSFELDRTSEVDDPKKRRHRSRVRRLGS